MGAVVTLYTEQKVPVSCFFLSQVNAAFVMAYELELWVLEGGMKVQLHHRRTAVPSAVLEEENGEKLPSTKRWKIICYRDFGREITVLSEKKEDHYQEGGELGWFRWLLLLSWAILQQKRAPAFIQSLLAFPSAPSSCMFELLTFHLIEMVQ